MTDEFMARLDTVYYLSLFNIHTHHSMDNFSRTVDVIQEGYTRTITKDGEIS